MTHESCTNLSICMGLTTFWKRGSVVVAVSGGEDSIGGMAWQNVDEGKQQLRGEKKMLRRRRQRVIDSTRLSFPVFLWSSLCPGRWASVPPSSSVAEEFDRSMNCPCFVCLPRFICSSQSTVEATTCTNTSCIWRTCSHCRDTAFRNISRFLEDRVCASPEITVWVPIHTLSCIYYLWIC